MKNPVTVTAVGVAAGAVATLPVSATKFNYLYKVTGWSDATTLITIASAGSASIEYTALADTPFDINFYGWYRTNAINTTITATIATSAADCSITIIGEPIN